MNFLSRFGPGSGLGRAESQLASELGELPLLGPRRAARVARMARARARAHWRQWRQRRSRGSFVAHSWCCACCSATGVGVRFPSGPAFGHHVDGCRGSRSERAAHRERVACMWSVVCTCASSRACCARCAWTVVLRSRVLVMLARGGALDGVRHAARDGRVGEHGRATCDRS